MGEMIKQAVRGNKPFWVCLSISILLILGGAFTPPMFVIDKSIFFACGIMFAFAMLYTFDKAIDNGHSAKISKGDAVFEVKKNQE